MYRDHIRRPILVGRHFISNVRAEPGSNGMIQTGAYFQAVFHERGRTRLQTGCYRDVCVETPSGLRIAHKRIEVDSTVLLPQRE
ncbi:hypothetical protein ABZU75_41965 [Streptosporangium sp. NPDC005286]|uniref:hypothetical protein n=1 Tax=Streptosporangium sp. NPDC005286 TaxID=3154463 RepID=UPI0033B498E1